MKHYFVLFLAGLLWSCSSTEESTNASALSSGDEQALRELVTTIWPQAYENQDTAVLNRILHAQFKLVDDQGESYSKEAEIQYAGKYGPSYDSFTYEVKGLSLFENGTAVISGAGLIRGQDSDGSYTTSYTSSDVFVKEGGEWKVINSHVSGVKEERE